MASRTILRYLENSYLYLLKARVVAVQPTTSAFSVVLDETIFHPQGGGQPSDRGTITSAKAKFNVTKSTFDAQSGIVHHEGLFEGDSKFDEGEEVSLWIDDNVRQLSRRNHSAGHLLALAVRECQLPIKEVKGYHFPEGPYVEFEGKTTNDAQKLIETKANELISKSLKMTATLVDKTKLAELSLVVPEHIPENKPTRVVTIDGWKGTPCGGTHVSNTFEIGPLQVRKITTRKENTKISYVIAPNPPQGWEKFNI